MTSLDSLHGFTKKGSDGYWLKVIQHTCFWGTGLITESFHDLGTLCVLNKYWNNLIKIPFI